MFRKFIRLEWKAFRRSPTFNVNLALKILMGFGWAYFVFAFTVLGVAAFYGLAEAGYEPLKKISQFLIYWWVGDLIIRYFLQQSPVLKVQPFIGLPIRKNILTNYILGKSFLSFFNIYPFFLFIPFTISLLINGYSIIGAIAWYLAILSLICINNFLFLLIDNKNILFISAAVAIASLGALQFFDILDITQYTGPVFHSFYKLPWTALIVIGIAVFMYRQCYHFYRYSLYLDDKIKKKADVASTHEYAWLNQFGLMGTFLKNDLKLIFRNKRPRNTVWVSLLFLFYGLLIFINPQYHNANAWLIFAGTFIPGGFLFSFGAFVPSWDSAYYPLMMSQNIKYQEYLASKWWLVTVATIVSMILSAFYLIIGVKYYLAILAGGVYNIGVNGYLVLLGGAYTKTAIDLSTGKKPFGDKKAFNVKTMLLTIPKIVVPIFIFILVNLFFGMEAGFLAVGLTGVAGLLFRNLMFRQIARIYKEEKYDTLLSYKKGAN